MIWTQQNVHGWTVAMLALSLCLNSVFIAAGHGYGLWGVEVEPTPPCIGVGIMAHFFYVASFAWMTVLNYDLFTTLTSLVPTSKKSKGKKLFAAYSLFAFVIPTIVVTISIILETQYRYRNIKTINRKPNKPYVAKYWVPATKSFKADVWAQLWCSIAHGIC